VHRCEPSFPQGEPQQRRGCMHGSGAKLMWGKTGGAGLRPTWQTPWTPVPPPSIGCAKPWSKPGMEAALARKRPTGRPYHHLDDAQEAQLVAVTCRAPPTGRTRWTLQFLADKLVELDVVATISAECVRTTLKKTHSNRGSSNNG